MAEMAAVYRRPFLEQIEALRLRLGNQVPTASWRDLWKGQHDRAFAVAGAMKADLLADLAGAVEKAISQGTSLQEFRKDFREIVERRGWHGWTGEETAQGRAWRTKVIYQTNMRISYMTGRYAQLVKGGYKYWVYRHGGSADPRLEHLSWDGLILPADHPFWITHFPPNGWGCSCYVLGARSMAAARRLGGKPDLKLPDGWAALRPETGEPHGIGTGWGYAPGRSVADDINEMVRRKSEKLPEKVAQDLARDATSPPSAPVYRDARSVKDAADLVVELGLAKEHVSWPSKSKLSAINTVIRTVYETEQAFDFEQMSAMGSATTIARRSRVLKNNTKAAAWYAMRSHAMGWNASGLSTELREEWPHVVAMRMQRHRKLVANLPDGPAKSAAEKTDYGWAVFPMTGGAEKPRWIAIHETGHRFHANFQQEVDEAISNWKSDGWHLALSEYGSSNHYEFVAESFALYMLKPDQHWRIKPELLTLFKAKDKRHVR